MGCRSDYMEPTTKERRLHETAVLYRYLLKRLGRKVPKEVQQAASSIYGGHDYVACLCELINEMSDKQRQRIIFQGRDATTLRLRNWWREHQIADANNIENGEYNHIRGVHREKLLDILAAKFRVKLAAEDTDTLLKLNAFSDFNINFTGIVGAKISPPSAQ